MKIYLSCGSVAGAPRATKENIKQKTNPTESGHNNFYCCDKLSEHIKVETKPKQSISYL